MAAVEPQTCPRCAIRDLLSRVAQLADGPDARLYAQQFTEDAVVHSPPNPAIGKGTERHEGRADIEEGGVQRRKRGIQGPGTNTRHVVTTVSVEVSGDTARATSYWMFFGETAQTPILISMGRYEDDLRMENDQWRVARRIATLG